MGSRNKYYILIITKSNINQNGYYSTTRNRQNYELTNWKPVFLITSVSKILISRTVPSFMPVSLKQLLSIPSFPFRTNRNGKPNGRKLLTSAWGKQDKQVTTDMSLCTFASEMTTAKEGYSAILSQKTFRVLQGL